MKSVQSIKIENPKFEKRSISRTKARLAKLAEADRPKMKPVKQLKKNVL